MVSETLYKIGSKRAPVRELFEYGKRKALEIGAENIFDFGLGNPSVPAPAAVQEAIQAILAEESNTAINGYTPSAGSPEACKAVVDSLNSRFGTSYRPEHVFLTCGAAPALIGCVRAMLADTDSEIIAIAPFFTEYRVYAEMNGGKLVVVPPDIPNFQINFEELEKRIGVHTQGIIINSPNNPSGSVYSRETIQKLADLLTAKSRELGHPIYLISDEPYREIVYGDVEVPWVPDFYQNTLVCYSYSKSLSLPGQRIGWALIPDEIADRARFYGAFLGAARACGQVCAPALYQKVIARCGHLTADMTVYQQNRDLLYNGLTAAGYDCVKPQGAFYLFMAAPNGNAEAFSDIAKESGILIPAGTAYGCPGYLRISYCVPTERVERALPIFEKLIKTL